MAHKLRLLLEGSRRPPKVKNTKVLIMLSIDHSRPWDSSMEHAKEYLDFMEHGLSFISLKLLLVIEICN